MITRYILDTFFQGQWHNYGHFTLGIIITGFVALWAPLWIAVAVSLGVTIGKEVADHKLDGNFNVNDIRFGIYGTLAAGIVMAIHQVV